MILNSYGMHIYCIIINTTISALPSKSLFVRTSCRNTDQSEGRAINPLAANVADQSSSCLGRCASLEVLEAPFTWPAGRNCRAMRDRTYRKMAPRRLQASASPSVWTRLHMAWLQWKAHPYISRPGKTHGLHSRQLKHLVYL